MPACAPNVRRAQDPAWRLSSERYLFHFLLQHCLPLGVPLRQRMPLLCGRSIVVGAEILRGELCGGSNRDLRRRTWRWPDSRSWHGSCCALEPINATAAPIMIDAYSDSWQTAPEELHIRSAQGKSISSRHHVGHLNGHPFVLLARLFKFGVCEIQHRPACACSVHSHSAASFHLECRFTLCDMQALSHW